MPRKSGLRETGLRIGSAAETAEALTRSHLADGRVVGWYGEPGVVIDAEIATQPVPAALAARHGGEDFWVRWTRMECVAKLTDVPAVLLQRDLDRPPPPGVELTTLRLADVVVSIGRRSMPPVM